MKFYIGIMLFLYCFNFANGQSIKVPGDFSNLPNAIQFANEGDTIFVFPSNFTYEDSYIYIDKSLVIIGLDSVEVQLNKSTRSLYVVVKNTKNVIIKNIEFGGSAYYFTGKNYPLAIINSEDILLDKVNIYGDNCRNPQSEGIPCGASVINSKRIFINNSTIIGGSGFSSSFGSRPGGFGLDIDSLSVVTLDNTLVHGGYVGGTYHWWGSIPSYYNNSIVINNNSICYANNCNIDPNVFTDSTSSIYYSSISTIGNEEKDMQMRLNIDSIYPNPFNPAINVKYTLYKKSLINISVYDILGNRITNILNKSQDIGEHHISWNGLNELGLFCASGTYLLVFKDGTITQTKKVLLLK